MKYLTRAQMRRAAWKFHQSTEAEKAMRRMLAEQGAAVARMIRESEANRPAGHDGDGE